MTRYLIVRLAALGDAAMTSALAREIKRRDARAHITWVAGSRIAGLVRLLDDVDEAIELDEQALFTRGLSARVSAVATLWRRLAGRRFDVTLIGHGDVRYRWLLAPVRTGVTRMLQHRPSRAMLPIAGRYNGDEYVRLLDTEPARGPIVGHFPLADLRPLAESASSRAPAAPGVVLVPGGARNALRVSALRRWPVERYRAVAEHLLLAGHAVTLVGDASDVWVRPFFAGLAVRDEIGRHDVAETLRILQAARLVVTHDTGPLHLAQLVRARTLALFGPTNPSHFVSPLTDVTVMWGGAGLACRPCYDGREFAECRDNLCMQDIAVADVIRQVQQLLPDDVTHARAREASSCR